MINSNDNKKSNNNPNNQKYNKNTTSSENISDNNTNDIVELTNAFLSVMDDMLEDKEKEKQEKNKVESHIKSIIPSLELGIDPITDTESNGILDEDNLGIQYEEESLINKSLVESINETTYEELSENREKRIFYSALYLSGRTIELSVFKKMLNPINLENRLLGYAEEFNTLRIGVKIRMVSEGYQIVTDSDVTPFLEKYFGERTESLSKASLETVAIIAYRQPITKVEVEEMREVNSSGTMRYLLDKNLIKVVGRKQVPGKPLLYATTKYFLEYFGLNHISELPTFREWQDLKRTD